MFFGKLTNGFYTVKPAVLHKISVLALFPLNLKLFDAVLFHREQSRPFCVHKTVIFDVI